MSSKPSDFFSSRLGLLLSILGIAIGTGNIWRFPRIVAQNGGGSFLIPWLIFLLSWSIPLLIVEFAMGKKTRKGPFASFNQLLGTGSGWMGGFVWIVATGIMFYYSVVCGWCFRYLAYSVTGTVAATSDLGALWNEFRNGYGSVVFHAITVLCALTILRKGILAGIERISRYLIPGLVFCLVVLAIRALTLPNAHLGLEYLFTPKLEDLGNARIWLNALAQNAWDTGAGWGLVIVYASYARREETVVANSAMTAIGNNLVSLIAGVLTFCAVGSLGSFADLTSGEGSTDSGLAFIMLPALFKALPGPAWLGSVFASIFFLGLSAAALTSLISMMKLNIKTYTDFGMPEKRALTLTAGLTFMGGLPSALFPTFFSNQDWVWGLGLIVSGLFFAFCVVRYGAKRFIDECINNNPGERKLGRIFTFLLTWVVPLEGITLLTWLFYDSIHQTNWLNPFGSETIATCFLQWGVAAATLAWANKQRSLRQSSR